MQSAPLHMSNSTHSGSLCHFPPFLPVRAEMDWRPLMLAKRKRSAVWSYFTVSDRETATCYVCRKAIRFSGNTTNLYTHLKAVHSKVNAKLQSKQREEEDRSLQTWSRPLAQRETLLTETFLQKLWQYPGSNFEKWKLIPSINVVSVIGGQRYSRVI